MTDKSKASQLTQLLDHLIHHDGITQLEAAELYGIWRLSARIWDLRALGYEITGDPEKGVNRYGKPCKWIRYRLDPEEKERLKNGK